jgi:hypothetical protein
LLLLPNFEFGIFPWHENFKVNMLAQQASGYDVGGQNFHIKREPMHYIIASGSAKQAKPAPELAKPVLLCVVADEPARPVCLQDFPQIGLNCSLLMLKPI